MSTNRTPQSGRKDPPAQPQSVTARADAKARKRSSPEVDSHQLADARHKGDLDGNEEQQREQVLRGEDLQQAVAAATAVARGRGAPAATSPAGPVVAAEGKNRPPDVEGGT